MGEQPKEISLIQTAGKCWVPLDDYNAMCAEKNRAQIEAQEAKKSKLEFSGSIRGPQDTTGPRNLHCWLISVYLYKNEQYVKASDMSAVISECERLEREKRDGQFPLPQSTAHYWQLQYQAAQTEIRTLKARIDIESLTNPVQMPHSRYKELTEKAAKYDKMFEVGNMPKSPTSCPCECANFKAITEAAK